MTSFVDDAFVAEALEGDTLAEVTMAEVTMAEVTMAEVTVAGIALPQPGGDITSQMTDEQKYRALTSRDRRFDGLFTVGVLSTGIYCRPSCPTPVQPKRSNIRFFTTAAAAQIAGLRACKRCRPDATPGSPAWATGEDIVSKAMRRIGQGYLDSRSVQDLARTLGVTERHLRRLMLSSVGAPPLALARAQRAQTARTLIETTSLKFGDVAFAAGFGSLRQFNETIKSVFAATPSELRRLREPSGPRCHDPSSGQRKPSGKQGLVWLSLRLAHRGPIAWRHLRSWFAARAVAGVSAVQGDALLTALRLNHGAGTALLTLEGDANMGSPNTEVVRCELALEAIVDTAAAVRQCRALLDLDADPTFVAQTLGAIPPISDSVKLLPGLRSVGSTDGFATAVLAVLGQQRSVAAAQTLATRIVARCREGGDLRDGIADCGSSLSSDVTREANVVDESLQPFPAAPVLADIDLGNLGLTRRNQATIRDLATSFCDGRFELAPDADRKQCRQGLLSIAGIGPWTADYILMRALGDPDIFLSGDLIARRRAAELGLGASQIDSARPWRSYLTHYLWASSTAGALAAETGQTTAKEGSGLT